MPRRINLIPPTERARTATNFGALALVAATILVVFALGLGYYLLSGSLDDRKQELATLREQTKALESQVVALEQYKALDTKRKNVEQVVLSAYAGRTLVSDILDKLSLVVPDNVWFESLSLTAPDPGAAVPDAVSNGSSLSLSGNTYSFEDIAQLLVRLQLIPSITNVNLQSAGAPTGSVDPTLHVKGFSIEAALANSQSDEVQLPVSQVEVEGL